jgi:hypothetical protein
MMQVAHPGSSSFDWGNSMVTHYSQPRDAFKLTATREYETESRAVPRDVIRSGSVSTATASPTTGIRTEEDRQCVGCWSAVRRGSGRCSNAPGLLHSVRIRPSPSFGFITAGHDGSRGLSLALQQVHRHMYILNPKQIRQTRMSCLHGAVHLPCHLAIAKMPSDS